MENVSYVHITRKRAYLRLFSEGSYTIACIKKKFFLVAYLNAEDTIPIAIALSGCPILHQQPD